MKEDEKPIVSLARSDRIALLGIAAAFITTLGGGSVILLITHDRDITTLRADNAFLKAGVQEANAELKVLRSDVSEMKALLTRIAGATWPEAYASGPHGYFEAGQ